MEILKDISVIWSLIHTLVLFLFLFESRFPRKKTITLTVATMAPLAVINFFLFAFLGFEKYGTLMLLTLSLPSCIIFWVLSKYRGGRFFFTFCVVDTIVLEIIYVTNILNHYLTPNTYWVMFIIRMLIYPLIELIVYKKLRPLYLEVQRHTKKGWTLFAVIGALFYVAITLLMTHPSPITERPEYLPVLVLLFILMPIIYFDIIATLRSQQQMHEMTEQKSILKIQVSNLTARMEELAAADHKFRVERHNFRHKMKTIISLLESEQYEECHMLLEEYNESLEKTKIRRFCQHSVIDAVLSSYIRRAEAKSIKLTYGFAFPDVIPVNETELATAIANALENAINACEKLEPEKRYIDIKVLDRPCFIIQIANSYEGDIVFDEDNIPVNEEQDHGFGTRYIAAFCQKDNGFYQFKAENGRFTLYLNF